MITFTFRGSVTGMEEKDFRFYVTFTQDSETGELQVESLVDNLDDCYAVPFSELKGTSLSESVMHELNVLLDNNLPKVTGRVPQKAPKKKATRVGAKRVKEIVEYLTHMWNEREVGYDKVIFSNQSARIELDDAGFNLNYCYDEVWDELYKQGILLQRAENEFEISAVTDAAPVWHSTDEVVAELLELWELTPGDEAVEFDMRDLKVAASGAAGLHQRILSVKSKLLKHGLILQKIDHVTFLLVSEKTLREAPEIRPTSEEIDAIIKGQEALTRFLKTLKKGK